MKRLKSSDLNLIGELANQHPDLAERLKVIRSHLAHTYGQQCSRDICSANVLPKESENDKVKERILSAVSKLGDSIIVELCDPHPDNPSPNIQPVLKVDLITALHTASAKVAKNPERAAEIRANWTDE